MQSDSRLNLIRDAWLPVRRRSGAIDTVRPADIVDPDDPPVALLWPRADFEIATLELLIGLTLAACPPANRIAWRNPPDAAAVSHAFDRLTPAFFVDGDGPRFLQDLSPLSVEAKAPDILFIDSAGENASKKRSDLMIRSNRYAALSRATAAIALFTLQSQAPAGGQGYRTSVRGGGPMITLVEPRRADGVACSLWDIVWANTPYGTALTDDETVAAFPWMRPTITSDKGETVHQTDRSMAASPTAAAVEAIFGMPRRIRLQFEAREGGRCGLTGQADPILVTGASQKPRGTNYGIWSHPLTPYYRPKAGEAPLPVHPKPGRLGYRNWIGVLIPDEENGRAVAETLRTFMADRMVTGALPDGTPLLNPTLLVSGWAMGNSAPLDFVLSRLPVPLAPSDALRAERDEMARGWVEAANTAQRSLTWALASAMPGTDEAATAIGGAADTFFRRTEPAVMAALGVLSRPEPALQAEAQGLAALFRRVALEIFEAWALSGLSDMKPEHQKRVIDAHGVLRRSLTGRNKSGAKLFEMLGLPVPTRPPEKEPA